LCNGSSNEGTFEKSGLKNLSGRKRKKKELLGEGKKEKKIKIQSREFC